MKNVCAMAISISSALATLALTILFIPGACINAQTGGRPRPDSSTPSGPVRPAPGGLKPSRTLKPPSVGERQFKIHEMERDALKPRTSEEEKLALAQIAEDYERIQVINNKMMSVTMPASAPNYKAIAETASEIRKRANRMLDNLRLPEANPEDATKGSPHKKATDVAQMKAALLSLDGSIMSFIRNPIFKNTGVVNVEEATKLRRDLETIIGFRPAHQQRC